MHCQEIRQQLATYRELSAAERDRLQEHLGTCASCAATLAAYTAQDQLLSALPVRAVSPGLVEALHARTVGRGRKARAFSWQRAIAVMSLLLCLGVAGGTVSRATGALPGDALYPIKRGAEQVRLALLFNPAARNQYQQHLAETRRAEVDRVLQQGRAVQVEFEGDLVQVEAESWQVDGFEVTVDARAWAGAPPPEGSILAVEAETAGGQIHANRVRLLQPAVTTPVPQASPSGPQPATCTPTAHQYAGEPTARPSPSAITQPAGTPGTWGPGPQPSVTAGAWGPGAQPSVTPGAAGPGPQPSVTAQAGGPGPQPSVTPGGWGPGPQPPVTPGAWGPGPQPSVTPGAGEPTVQPTTTPGTSGPGPQPSVTPGAGEPTAQPTTTPGTIGPGPQPSVTPGAGEPTAQPTATPGAFGPGPQLTATPGTGGR